MVFVQKYHRRSLFYALRKQLGPVSRGLALHRESRVEEDHFMPDHVHMVLSVSPKRSESDVVGYLKGKSAIWIAHNVNGRRRNFYGESFCARGYFVSTVGRDGMRLRHSRGSDRSTKLATKRKMLSLS